MKKIKHERTADCVVAGYRVHKSGPDRIGSLLLGLYTDDGRLASVGVVGALPMAQRHRAVRGASAAGDEVLRGIRGTGERMRPGSGRRGRPWPAGGTRTRTCRSSRCARSACSRSATTTWKARGSGTRPSSSGGARTASRAHVPTPSWRSRSASTWPRSCAAGAGGLAWLSRRRCWSWPGHEVAISNPSKVFFPRAGVTKLDMVRYYLAVAAGALARGGRAADGAEAVRERGRGRGVLPEAGPGEAAGLDRDRGAALPVRPHRRRGGGQRRGRAGLGDQPGLHRPEPAPGARRRPGSPGRAAGRPGPGARRGMAADPGRGPGGQGRAGRLRADRLAEDLGVARACTSTRGSSRAGRSPRCGGRRWRWRGRSSGGRRTWRPPSGGRRSGTACSSTTTRTPRTARSPRRTPSARSRTPGCRRR